MRHAGEALWDLYAWLLYTEQLTPLSDRDRIRVLANRLDDCRLLAVRLGVKLPEGEDLSSRVAFLRAQCEANHASDDPVL